MAEDRKWEPRQEAGIEHFDLGSFDEFTTIIHDRYWLRHNIVWRGQRDGDWNLESSLSRFTRKLISKEFEGSYEVLSDSINLEGNRARKVFADRSRFVLREPIHGIELWALYQHNGGNSPLLDWTRSPYVASFFAYADVVLTIRDDERGQQRLAVWGMHRTALLALADAACRQIRGEEGDASLQLIDLQIADSALANNVRMVAQQGLFTYSNPMLPLDLWVKQHSKRSLEIPFKSFLTKITLPIKEAEQALTHLNKMNINFATLFPDIGGATQHAMLSSIIDDYEGINVEPSHLLG